MTKKSWRVVLLSGVLFWASWMFSVGYSAHGIEQPVNQPLQDKESTASSRFETYSFDNCRSFVPRTRDVGELGDDGWVKITAKGRRDYIAEIDARRCALVVVDMQNGQYGPDSFVERVGKYNPEIPKVWNKRMKEIVIPNTNRLVRFFREKGAPIVYLQLGDSGLMPEIEAQSGPEEFLVTKFSAGAFATSTLDQILREFGVATVFFTGTDTACCLTATVDEAYDRNYQTIIIEDACIANRQEMHNAAILIWAYRAFVRSTDQVINDYPWQGWIDPNLHE